MGIDLIELEEGVSIASPYPCVYLEEQSTLLFADTHLGLEEQRERLGIHIPYPVTEHIIECIMRPVRELSCRRVMILGDVKHEFGRPSAEEWYSLKKLVGALRRSNCELEVVRGNHDNYIIYILNELGVKLHDPHALLERSDGSRILLIHGHLESGLMYDESKHIRLVVMGHEHPSIAIKDDLGAKHRFKAFLYGRAMVHGAPGTSNSTDRGQSTDVRILVLPSLSPLAYGNPLNENTVIKSPVLRRIGVEWLTPYLIEVGMMVKRFPEVRHLMPAR
ncbi:MAG: metallophosphoesterase [Candidatus Nitrosocaldus sp.]|nr:metallophosphoesterase [Candidatus Nitrosocaldus sp.]MDW7999596.1 metallophosphoesterase [Candidatus Nitrosocaldus sp.]